MIHLILTTEDGVVKIPAIIRGDQDVPSVSALGSHNYTHRPVAVLCGAGYGPDAVEQMRNAVRDTGTGAEVAWMMVDVSKNEGLSATMPGYGEMLTRRLKETFKAMEEERTLGKTGGVVWY